MSRRNAWSWRGGGLRNYIYYSMRRGPNPDIYLNGRAPTSFVCYFFILIEPSTRIDVYEKSVSRGLWGWVVEGEGGSANIKTYPINAALLNISSAPLFAEWPPSVRPLNEMKSVGKCFIYRFASVAIMSRCVCVTPGPICFDISRVGGGPGTGDIFTTTAPPPHTHKLREIYLYLWRCQ